MPDEPITNTESPEVNINVDNNEEKSIAQTESEFMEETVKGIKDTQKAILEQDTLGDNNDSDDSSRLVTDSRRSDSNNNKSTQLEELAGTEIPEAFSSVAEELGILPAKIVALADNRTDEQLLNIVPFLQTAEALGMTPTEIVAIADSHTDEQLLEMAAFLKESAGVDADDAEEDEAVDEKPESKEYDEETTETQELIDQAVAKIKAELGIGLEEINEFKSQQAAQQDERMLETANRKFDEAVKEFPIFGDTEKLPRFTTGRLKGQFIPTSPAFKARMEVIKYADAFMSTGNSVEEAMDLALNTYKGKNLRTEVERNLIKDLKQHERSLSGVRTGKETKRKYADSREEILDDIRALQRKAGVEV